MDKALTIKLTDRLAALLTEHSQELEITKAELIRKSLDHYLQHLKIVGKASSSIERFIQNPGVEQILIESIQRYAENQAIVEADLKELENRGPTESEEAIRQLGEEG